MLLDGIWYIKVNLMYTVAEVYYPITCMQFFKINKSWTNLRTLSSEQHTLSRSSEFAALRPRAEGPPDRPRRPAGAPPRYGQAGLLPSRQPACAHYAARCCQHARECNCLEDSRRSQSKYLSRARARVSSFWSLTKQEGG